MSILLRDTNSLPTTRAPEATVPADRLVPGRAARLLRGRPDDPRWVRPALFGLLAATAVLYLVGFSASGYANQFYAAAAQAGTKSWEAFFFGSLGSKIHYFVPGNTSGGGTSTATTAGSAITSWVQATYEATTVGGATVYDLTATSTTR